MTESNGFDLSEVTKPVNTARGLPNAHYIDDAVFEEEREAVLFNNWAGVGFAKDASETGDAMPVDFLGMPLLILRDQDGVVKVFQNTCRHRGMILVQEKGNIRGTTRCLHHSWCYGLDGTLRSTPHAGGPGVSIHEDIKRNELGLVEIRGNEAVSFSPAGNRGQGKVAEVPIEDGSHRVLIGIVKIQRISAYVKRAVVGFTGPVKRWASEKEINQLSGIGSVITTGRITALF